MDHLIATAHHIPSENNRVKGIVSYYFLKKLESFAAAPHIPSKNNRVEEVVSYFLKSSAAAAAAEYHIPPPADGPPHCRRRPKYP
jgi:hypothetical protein